MNDLLDIFVWDGYSDQPYPIRNRAYKKQKRKENILDIFILGIVNILLFPFFVIVMYLTKRENQTSNNDSVDIFGMGVNLDKEDKIKNIDQLALINELNIKKVFIRIYLSDIENLLSYKEFIDRFINDGKEVVINIIQDRENIENHTLLKDNIVKIFTSFDTVERYQIGSTINRTKWGFFGIKEYLEFYKIVQNVKEDLNLDIKLIAPPIIDFEYYFTIRALYNFVNVKFDILSSLLYVDRRGAPENTQYGIFDTTNKIRLLHIMSKLSTKIRNKDEILITEANWPISNTAPYAPTSEVECVSIEDYSAFMVRYYLLAISTGSIKTIYWHQLIAKGYGLYNQDENYKYASFGAYQTMVYHLQDMKFVKLIEKDKTYMAYFENDIKFTMVCWHNLDINSNVELNIDNDKIFSIDNKELQKLIITKSPIYVIKNKLI